MADLRGGGVLEAIGDAPLDRSGPPLHQQLRRRIEAAIASGSLAPGAALPTEQELQDALGISRSVVRQALVTLAGRGAIERRRGRGSVIAAPRGLRRSAERAGGLRQHVEQQGGSLRTSVLSLDPVTLDAALAAELGDTDAWALDRVRSIDGVPAVAGATWFSRSRFPRATVEALTDASLLDWMREHGARPVGGHRQLRAVPADELRASRLDVPIGTSLLLLEGVTEDAAGHVLERFELWHAPQTVFDVEARVDADAERRSAIAEVRSQLSALEATLARLEG